MIPGIVKNGHLNSNFEGDSRDSLNFIDLEITIFGLMVTIICPELLDKWLEEIPKGQPPEMDGAKNPL